MYAYRSVRFIFQVPPLQCDIVECVKYSREGMKDDYLGCTCTQKRFLGPGHITCQRDYIRVLILKTHVILDKQLLVKQHTTFLKGKETLCSLFLSVPNSGLSLSAPLFALQVISYSSPPPVKLSMPSIVESSSEYDLIVVGAGVLGSAAAKAFGSDGRRVLLLERDLSEPDRIVGELLQPGGVNALTALGMEGMA